MRLTWEEFWCWFADQTPANKNIQWHEFNPRLEDWIPTLAVHVRQEVLEFAPDEVKRMFNNIFVWPRI